MNKWADNEKVKVLMLNENNHILIQPFSRCISSMPKLLQRSIEQQLIQYRIHRCKYGPPYRNDVLLQDIFLNEIQFCKARKKCRTESIHKCLLNKVNPNIYAKIDGDMMRHRAIHIAAELGNTELVKMLLKAGAKVNQQNGLGQTPLMIAVHGRVKQQNEMLKILLFQYKCDIDIKDRAGNTALEYSIRASNMKAVSIILLAISKNIKCVPNTVSAAKKLVEEDDKFYQNLDPNHKARVQQISLLLPNTNMVVEKKCGKTPMSH